MKPVTVLLVEDHADLRETMTEALETFGIVTKGVGNGQEALEYLHREPPPSLILLDLAMPVMDGFRFREEQQKAIKLKDIPVFVLSAETHLAEKAQAMGVAGHMTKPVDLQKLLALVRSRLG
jgi:two-component system response regulator CpxR